MGGLRYHTGIPNVKLGRLRVAVTRLLTMPNGGNRKGIVWLGTSPNNSQVILFTVLTAIVVCAGWCCMKEYTNPLCLSALVEEVKMGRKPS